MSVCIVTSIDRVPAYDGPGKIDGIAFRAVGRALGVSAWGMNVLELAPGAVGYPSHDHVKDGQEETYLLLAGDAVLVAGDERHVMKTGDIARVPPALTRTWEVGPHGVTLLAIGGTPGKAFVSMIPG